MTVVITRPEDPEKPTHLSVSDGEYQEKVLIGPGQFVTLTGENPRIISGNYTSEKPVDPAGDADKL